MHKAEMIKAVKKELREILSNHGLSICFDIHSGEHVFYTQDKGLFDDGYMWMPVSDLRKRWKRK